MPALRNLSLVTLAACGLGLSACGGAGTPSAQVATTSTTPGLNPVSTSSTTSTTAAPTTIASIPPQDRSPAGTAGTAPTVIVPSGAPPKELESADLITGTGAVAQAGDQLTMQYVLATYSSGKVIQSSWTSQPFQFTLGEGQVIPGWDKGVVGMQVGGRRELIIPPSLGYGARSPGAGIAVNDTLVFVVDLLQIS